jgi:methylmalonyl-CoA mutase cobalamin-binding domain/chain
MSTEIPQDIRDGITEALHTGEEASADELTRRALEMGCDPLEVVQSVIVPALTEVGDRFQALEIFLPELMLSAKAGEASTKLLEAAILETSGDIPNIGTVVLGTVDKDIHDIGKNILATLMKANGFKVVDVGRNINAQAFVEAALESDAEIIGASSLMTITKAGCKQIVELLKARGMRDRFKVMIGGGSVDQRYAEMIEADGYAHDATGGVALAKQWMEG